MVKRKRKQKTWVEENQTVIAIAIVLLLLFGVPGGCVQNPPIGGDEPPVGDGTTPPAELPDTNSEIPPADGGDVPPDEGSSAAPDGEELIEDSVCQNYAILEGKDYFESNPSSITSEVDCGDVAWQHCDDKGMSLARYDYFPPNCCIWDCEELG